MEREEAIEKLQALVGKDLFPLAEPYGVTTWKENGKQNKGWFGHVIERVLGLPLNSSHSPNFGSWELKTTSLKRLSSGEIVPKETIAVTMIDKYEVIQKDFFDSDFYLKLRKEVIVARIVSRKFEDSGIVHSVTWFDLNDKELLDGIKQDYDLIRETLRKHGNPIDGDLSCLRGKMGIFVQPRTKGRGHGSTSRAFYMRKGLVKIILGL